MTNAPGQPRLILAPMKGYTDAVFRNTLAEHFPGFDAALAPFVAATGADRISDKHLRDLLPQHNTLLPVEPQILGNNADDFIFMAGRFYEMGYPEVNLNLGCPFRPVTKKARGSGLLPYPDRLDEFLDRTLAAIPGRLSIKMRLGRSRSDEIFKLLPVLDRYPLRDITVHPRTARQMYAGKPDLDSFDRFLGASRHRVVYNGDITDLTGFQSLADRFPSVRSWMIGRGALSNPFLPALIKNASRPSADPLQKFKLFYEDLFARYQERLEGPGHLLDRMKGFWTYFGGAFRNAADIARRIHHTFTLPRYRDTVERFFAEEAVWRED